MMNRRDALKLTAGLLVSYILPAPRSRIDLRSFCGEKSWKYDYSHPWEYQDWTYATEAHVCVRVRPESGDRTTGEGKMPPFGSVPWDHDRLGGWAAMPEARPLMAADSDCPACNGYGYAGGASRVECPHCNDGWDLDQGLRCKRCKGEGWIPPPGVPVCRNCQGHAIGTFPAVVQLGGLYYDVTLYRKVQALGAECAGFGERAPTRFRFDGGTGLLMPIQTDVVVSRLEKAGGL